MATETPLNRVLAQIKNAKQELASYAPSGFAWYDRCVESAKTIVPWLEAVAPELKLFVEEVVNSKQLVRNTWKQIKDHVEKKIPPHLLALMDKELDREAILLESVGGNIVSKVIEKHLIKSFPGKLCSNGASDYPDLYLGSNNYDKLPVFARIKNKSILYGAAVKGKEKRPVRVPDGLEIKTCKGRLAVDCHHAHVGLHLVLQFRGREGTMEVVDVLVAFLRLQDYRITKPSTPTTTLKASFNGDSFISLLSKQD